jgi:hypothetical protein
VGVWVREDTGNIKMNAFAARSKSQRIVSTTETVKHASSGTHLLVPNLAQGVGNAQGHLDKGMVKVLHSVAITAISTCCLSPQTLSAHQACHIINRSIQAQGR